MSNENKKTQFSKLTIQDLVNFDNQELQKKDKNELLRLTREISRFAKNRYIRTQKWLSSIDNLATPTVFRKPKDDKKIYKNIDRLDFDLDIKKINSKNGKNYLIHKFFNAKNFLMTKTSTVKGWEESLGKFINTISEKTKLSITIKDIKKKDKLDLIFDLYKKLRSVDTYWKGLSSSQAFVGIISTVENLKIDNFDTLYKILSKKAEEIYEENTTRTENIKDEDEDIEDFEDFTPDWR